MTPLYTAQASIIGGRDGRATARDGHPDLLLKPPPELGGPADVAEATNPEELFALGYGACFLSALQGTARRKKLSAKDYTLESSVSLLQDDEGAYSLAVQLRGELPGVDVEEAKELMRAAHATCPYSRATAGNIAVELFVGGEPV